MARRVWNRNELVLAFNLYCKVPFGRIHRRNPEIVLLAKILDRTPSALSWKLANFARLDPALRKRGIQGAGHGSSGEIEIWKEFNDDWEALAFESESALRQSRHEPLLPSTDDLTAFPEGLTREALTRVRVNQGFFRSAVLAAYNDRCCITGLSSRQLLVASHIVPWATDSTNRTNPRNGLCLSALHDRAFDCGLITVMADLTVRISPRVHKSATRDAALRELFLRYESSRILLPSRFLPDAEFLRYHNDNIFQVE